MNASIVGWSHLPFVKKADAGVEAMIVEVARAAMADAGVAAGEIDAVYLGHFNGGFSAQDFTASLVLQADPALRFKPATRVENACATGSAAVHGGVRAIRAGEARLVLVVGVEKMTDLSGPEIGRTLLKASYLPEDGAIEGGFAGVFGQIAQRYFQRYGDQSDALAAIAAKNHANGVANPFAQMRKDLGFDFCRAESERNPFVAGPLKRTDCSLVSDGAAGPGAGRSRYGPGDEQGGHLPRRGAYQRLPADEQARHPQVRRLRRGLVQGAGRCPHAAGRPRFRRDP